MNIVMVVSYLLLTYIDDDQGVTNFFDISPLAFSLAHISRRELILKQFQPSFCDLASKGERVICTLKYLVKKYDLKYQFIRYDEGKRNVVLESWNDLLTLERFTKHEKKLQLWQSKIVDK